MTRDSGDAGAHDDWNVPRPAVVPRPTYFPAATAFAVTLLLWGLVTSPVVLGAGAVVMTIALKGWIGEVLDDQRR